MHVFIVPCSSGRPSVGTVNLSPTDQHVDPKQQRKLRQQQLQQRFREEMEAKKMQEQGPQHQNPLGEEPGASHGKMVLRESHVECLFKSSH